MLLLAATDERLTTAAQVEPLVLSVALFQERKKRANKLASEETSERAPGPLSSRRHVN